MQKLLAAVLLLVATPSAFGVAVWGQCGGLQYSGSTVCDAGTTCVYLSDWYSQCQPASTSTTISQTTNGSTNTVTATTTGTSAPIPTPPVGYTQLTNFGPNPNNVTAWIYRPQTLASPPPLIVAMHYCTGTAEAYYTGTRYAQIAEQKGYYVIYPEAPRDGTCWDVNTNETLTHNSGGDSLGIVSAVRYAIQNFGADANKIYATGTSSGAMMTSVLMGAYPDIFQAGAVDSGEPYGCFAGAYAWNSDCSEGLLIKTPQEWGDLVRSGYPGYTGSRPSVQVWHGTIDTALSVQTGFWEAIKQWTNVFGYSETPITNVSMSGFPDGYSNATYGPKFQAILAQGVGHTVPVFEDSILEFFGL